MATATVGVVIVAAAVTLPGTYNLLNNEVQKCSIESTTTTTTEWKCGGISRAKPLMTNADQASVRLSGRANCHDFQHRGSVLFIHLGLYPRASIV